MNYNLLLLLFFFLFSSCQNNYKSSLDQLDEKFGVYIDRISRLKVKASLEKGLKPIALKDNIDAVGFANTAGSMALKQNFPKEDAFLVQKLFCTPKKFFFS